MGKGGKNQQHKRYKCPFHKRKYVFTQEWAYDRHIKQFGCVKLKGG